MKLIHTNNQNEVLPYEVLHDFKGRPGQIVDWRSPNSPTQPGRIVVLRDSQHPAKVYHPSVFGLRFVEDSLADRFTDRFNQEY